MVIERSLGATRRFIGRHENEHQILCLLVLFKRLKEKSLHHLGGATTDDATPPPPTLILKADARTEMDNVSFFTDRPGAMSQLSILKSGARGSSSAIRFAAEAEVVQTFFFQQS